MIIMLFYCIYVYGAYNSLDAFDGYRAGSALCTLQAKEAKPVPLVIFPM